MFEDLSTNHHADGGKNVTQGIWVLSNFITLIPSRLKMYTGKRVMYVQTYRFAYLCFFTELVAVAVVVA